MRINTMTPKMAVSISVVYRTFRLGLSLAIAITLGVSLAGQSVMPTPRQQFLDNNGDPCASCLLHVFNAGTNTRATTYTDPTLSTPNANPVVLDSAGRATIFLDARVTFKFTLATPTDVPIWTVDSVDAVPSALNVEVNGVAGETLAQRQIVYLSSGLDSTTAGRWYLTDADVVSKSSGATLVGVVISTAISAASSGTIRIQGRVSGFSGLSEGLTYFVSATAGAVTSTAPAQVKVVGVAESPTTLLLTPSSASSGGVGAFSSLQVSSTAANSIDTAGGIEAGSGNVQVVNAAGNVLEAAIADGTILARNAANETVTGAWTFAPNRTVAASVQFTGLPGGASATTIGVNGGKLAFLGGASGHQFLSQGGGPLTEVDAGGNWTFLGSSGRSVVVSRTGGDAGVSINSVGGSGTAYALTSRADGIFSLQHDVDGNPTVALNGAANVLSLAATGGINISTGAVTTLDAAGNWSMPGRINSATAQPGFLARRIGNQAIGGPGSTIVIFDTDLFDDASNYDTATGTFTAPVAGRYLFGASVSATIPGTLFLAAMGTRFILGSGSSGPGTVLVSLAQGETALVTFDTSGAGTILAGADVLTYFWGRLVP